MISMHVARVARQRRRRRQHQGVSAPQVIKWILAVLVALLGLLLVLTVVLAGVLLIVYRYYASQLPSPDEIVKARDDAALTSELYDRTGQTVIYEVIDPSGDRRWIDLDSVPQYFVDATVAIEDASFYDNPGFDLQGMGRALWTNLTSDQIQGGSTITQQLVKNVLLDPEERTEISVDRKIKEVILAAEISRLYSKDQIMEWYINTISYGGWAVGIEAAAQQYFGKPARDLTLAEATMLAAIPQFPLQNPVDNPDAAKYRQGLVLGKMAEQGYITQAQADTAYAEQLAVRPPVDRYYILAPHFALYARAEAEAILNDLGLDGATLVGRGGVRVYTTLDLDLQLQAECTAATYVTRLDGADATYTRNTSLGTACDAASYLPPYAQELVGVDREVTNASAVVLRAQTGEILAMVGSVDYWNEGIDGSFNVAVAARQSASVFKPIVYTAAFLQGALPGYPNGITAATMLYDVPIEFDNGGEPYTPVNIDRQYHGPVSVRDALANSYNVPPVQVANLIGLGPILRTAHRLGINTLTQGSTYGLALALGSGEVSLLDLTYSYNVFNTNGYLIGMPVHEEQVTPGFRSLNPVAVLRIEDNNGKVLWEYGQDTNTFQQRLILEPALAYIMTDMLADNEAREPAFGYDNPMRLSRPAAVKTGTSNDNKDSWTIGYTPQIVTGVWVGNNNNHSMNDITGQSGAAPIWHAIMEYAHTRDNLPVEEWSRPATVTEQMDCQISGLLPTRDCPTVRELFYVDPSVPIDTRPVQPDTYWNTYSINVCTGRLATASSSPECVENELYFDYPQETRAWARDTGQRFPPDAYDVVEDNSPFSEVTIISPSYLARVSGVVEIRGNADDENFAYYRLDYGAGQQPDVWFQIGETQVEPGRAIVLGTWDTTTLSDGMVYTLRLQMVRADNSLESDYNLVTVDNAPPAITLTSPTPGSTYQMGQDVYIELQAEPEDNVQVGYVEFYRNDELFATSEVWPYTARWDISASGEQIFWAVVYDAAGNSAESERITVTTQP